MKTKIIHEMISKNQESSLAMYHALLDLKIENNVLQNLLLDLKVMLNNGHYEGAKQYINDQLINIHDQNRV